jgi:hypothetical protein
VYNFQEGLNYSLPTIFPVENRTANSSRQGIIQIKIPKDISDLKLLAPNRRVKTELEVVFNVKSEDYDKYVHLEISVDDARKLVKDLSNVNIPSRIHGYEKAKQ